MGAEKILTGGDPGARDGEFAAVVKLRSSQYDLAAADNAFDSVCDLYESATKGMGELDCGAVENGVADLLLAGIESNLISEAPTEIATEAVMVVSDGGRRIEISYADVDTDDSGIVIDTKIAFEVDTPRCVTVTRGGSSMYFEYGKRCICAYDTGYLPIELCVYPRIIRNSIGYDGGHMRLDYFIEFYGAGTQRIVLDVDVRLLGEAS